MPRGRSQQWPDAVSTKCLGEQNPDCLPLAWVAWCGQEGEVAVSRDFRVTVEPQFHEDDSSDHKVRGRGAVRGFGLGEGGSRVLPNNSSC
jgi:hypothetical protein